MIENKNFVRFMSPGTLFHEETSKPINEWSTLDAVKMASEIVERYNSRPFAFVFETYTTSDPIPDGNGGTLEVKPKLIKKSGRHFLGGEVLTEEKLKQRDPEGTEILRSNMRCNGWNHVIENTNSFKVTQPFEKDDCIVDDNGSIVVRACDLQ